MCLPARKCWSVCKFVSVVCLCVRVCVKILLLAANPCCTGRVRRQNSKKNNFPCSKNGARLWLLWLQKQKMGKNGCSQKDVILGRPRNFDVCRAPIKILPGDREKSPFRGKPPPFSRLWSEVFAPSPWFHWATENHIFLVALVFDKKGSISSTIATKTTHFLCTKSCCLLIFTPSLFAPLFGRTPPRLAQNLLFGGVLRRF